MKPRIDEELESWLAAEEADDAERAEAALAALFTALPLGAPPAGFAGRVMARAGLASRRLPLGRLWARVTACLALAGAGTFALVAPQLVRGLAATVEPAALLAAGPRLLAAATATLARVLELAVKLLDVARAVAAPFASPAVAVAALAALAVAAVALRLLHDLISNQRSWSYVDVHG